VSTIPGHYVIKLFLRWSLYFLKKPGCFNWQAFPV
jgi:hypothetical protein